jgi:ATP-dependent Lon protease
MAGGSPEATVVRTYLDPLIDLPRSEADEARLEIKHSLEVLDEDHYALEEPKERIIEFLAVRQLTKDLEESDYKAPILCLVGPPGVGKTSLGKSIARSLNRKFVRMSLGGVRDEAEIRGHRRTYIGSLPGRIIQGMKTAGTVNPVFLLDEVDKMTSDFRGDPSSALLEVLDPEQNDTFTDHYLEIPYDLSKVMFVTTANSLSTIPRPLLDRMEVIQIPGYTLDEKIQIARRYRVPRQLRDHGLIDHLEISDDALRRIVTEYTREAGVRNLDRLIAKVARKSAKEFLEEPWEGKREVGVEEVRELLGVPPYRDEQAEKEAQVGLAHGLAWTSVGGVTLDIEAVAIPGKGTVTLTGQLGDVMKESAQAGIAYLRKHADEYGIAPGFHESRDLHVHVLEGATPKDGPSAGIAMASAVVSALTGRKLRGDVAMTGEISLRGRVLPIGGVKEKLLAAHQAGIKTVILPHENEANLEEVPETILGELEVITVKEFREVLDVMLIGEPETSAAFVQPPPRSSPVRALPEPRSKAPAALLLLSQLNRAAHQVRAVRSGTYGNVGAAQLFISARQRKRVRALPRHRRCQGAVQQVAILPHEHLPGPSAAQRPGGVGAHDRVPRTRKRVIGLLQGDQQRACAVHLVAHGAAPVTRVSERARRARRAEAAQTATGQ